MSVTRNRWRPLVLGLAAAVFTGGPVLGQNPTLAERIAQCAGCHGADGNSPLPKIPSLAGQPAFFILNQLFLMREGVRKVAAMAPFVKDLKDSDLDALATHYAKLPPKASNESIDPALIKRGAEIVAQKKCVSCHKPNFAGDEQVPRIAKQRVDYMIEALQQIRDSKRESADTLMSGAVAGLADADLAALAHYAAAK
ncbi:MAG TPA: c-type cytochrome [Stellaceae bacterium]|nr:c-type cytochrome [Xanthobacteraceae bacterium]HUK08743.1 c-type cytochrome [Stellaceae bacterium]